MGRVWFTGTNTGKVYVEGQRYTSAGDTYRANRDGTFTNERTGRTSVGSSQDSRIQWGTTGSLLSSGSSAGPGNGGGGGKAATPGKATPVTVSPGSTSAPSTANGLPMSQNVAGSGPGTVGVKQGGSVGHPFRWGPQFFSPFLTDISNVKTEQGKPGKDLRMGFTLRSNPYFSPGQDFEDEIGSEGPLVWAYTVVKAGANLYYTWEVDGVPATKKVISDGYAAYKDAVTNTFKAMDSGLKEAGKQESKLAKPAHPLAPKVDLSNPVGAEPKFHGFSF